MGKITNLSSFGSRRGSMSFAMGAIAATVETVIAATVATVAGSERASGGMVSAIELFREGFVWGDFIMTGTTVTGGATLIFASTDDIGILSV